MSKIHVRAITKMDVPDVLRIEASFYKTTDPDFGEHVAIWALGEKDIYRIENQKADPKRGIYETRFMVLDTNTSPPGNKAMFVNTWVCGHFCYEIWDNALYVLHAGFHRGGPLKESIEAMLRWFKEKADTSKKTKRIIYYVRDCDSAGIRDLLPALRANGFTVKLKRDCFKDDLDISFAWKRQMDGWECEYVAPEVEGKDDHTPELLETT